MNLLGSRTRTSTIGSGTFACPRETGIRRYQVKVVRRWATLSLGRVRLRVAPLGEIARFVECQSCASTFEPGVLAHRDAMVEDILTRVLRRSAGKLFACGGRLSDADRREAVIVLQRYANVPYAADDLRRDIETPAGRHLDAELRGLSTSLNDHGRDVFTAATQQLVSVTGTPDPQRLETLEALLSVVAKEHHATR